MHRDLANGLQAVTMESNQSWEDALPQVLFAMRTNVCSSTGLAPFQIIFGRDPSAPLDMLFGDPNEDRKDESLPKVAREYVRELRHRITTAQDYAKTKMASAVSRQRRQYNQDRKAFVAGAKVWLFTPQNEPGVPRKLQSYWSGPYIICADSTLGDTMARITPSESEWHGRRIKIRNPVVSIDRLKPYCSRIVITTDQDVTMLGDEDAEGPFQTGPAEPPVAEPLAKKQKPSRPESDFSSGEEDEGDSDGHDDSDGSNGDDPTTGYGPMDFDDDDDDSSNIDDDNRDESLSENTEADDGSYVPSSSSHTSQQSGRHSHTFSESSASAAEPPPSTLAGAARRVGTRVRKAAKKFFSPASRQELDDRMGTSSEDVSSQDNDPEFTPSGGRRGRGRGGGGSRRGRNAASNQLAAENFMLNFDLNEVQRK
jgi:hypothetical protein